MASLKYLVLGFIFTIATSAEAAWVSGGGKIRKDEQNPWWLFNTTEVSWCVEIDEQAISIDKTVAAANARSAIDYWKTELSLAARTSDDRGEFPPGQLVLATQTFTFHESCAGDEDLTFYFGKVSVAFRDYLTRLGEKANDYIGMAIRTEYDRQSMHGKGFVYIAPDRSSSPDFPASQRMQPNVWSAFEGANLQGALQHELGHVFGLPHENDLKDEMGYLNLMSEDYPEHAAQGDDTVARRQFPRLIEWGDDSSYSSCWGATGQELRNYLGVSEDVTCFRVNKSGPLDLVGIRQDGSESVLARLETPAGRFSHTQFKVTAWFPTGQRVLKLRNGTYVKNSRVRLDALQESGSYLFTITPTNRPNDVRYGEARFTTECYVMHVESRGDQPTVWYPMATNPHQGMPIGNCGKG